MLILNVSFTAKDAEAAAAALRAAQEAVSEQIENLTLDRTVATTLDETMNPDITIGTATPQTVKQPVGILKKKSVKKRRPSITNAEPLAAKPDDVPVETVSAVVPEGETTKDSDTIEDKTATSTASAAPSKKASKSKPPSKSAGLFVGGLLAFGAKPKSKSGSKKKKVAEQSGEKETTATGNRGKA